MLKFEKTGENEYVLSGRLDAGEVDNVRPALDGITSTATINCEKLAYISSAGLGVLLATQIRLQKSGGKLRLVKVVPFVRNVLMFSGFDKLFEIVE